jgi:hypothetical protein
MESSTEVPTWKPLISSARARGKKKERSTSVQQTNARLKNLVLDESDKCERLLVLCEDVATDLYSGHRCFQ